MKQPTLTCLLLLTVLAASTAANTCNGTDLTTQLYPVKGQPFLLPLSNFFAGEGLTYSSNLDSQFHVQQTVVRAETLEFSGEPVTSVLKIA